MTAYDFASGEIYVRFNESVRGADVFVLQSIAGDINIPGLNDSTKDGDVDGSDS